VLFPDPARNMAMRPPTAGPTAKEFDLAKYRNALPQLGDDLFLTDGGLETTLIFHDGLDLPEFAAFDLLKHTEGTARLRAYFCDYAEIAKQHGAGFILESPTWRASSSWATRLGYTRETLADANRAAISLLQEIREDLDTVAAPVVISGCIGPQGDSYGANDALSASAAETYHSEQIEILADTAADMVAAVTMPCTEEAIGIVRAAARAGMPVAISFTVETDGRLPSGETLREAIGQVDAATSSYPSYYMINCAHPTHFESTLAGGGAWVERIRGLRANASSLSHAELDEAPELDPGDPDELGIQYAALKKRLSHLTVLGGCCGTDLRHVARIAEACAPLFRNRGGS